MAHAKIDKTAEAIPSDLWAIELTGI